MEDSQEGNGQSRRRSMILMLVPAAFVQRCTCIFSPLSRHPFRFNSAISVFRCLPRHICDVCNKKKKGATAVVIHSCFNTPCRVSEWLIFFPHPTATKTKSAVGSKLASKLAPSWIQVFMAWTWLHGLEGPIGVASSLGRTGR